MATPASLDAITRLLEAGQFEQGRAQLLRLLQRSPTDGPLNNLCAIAHLRLGQPTQALFFAERAAATGASPEFFETLAHTLANNRRPAEGIAAYRRAIAMDPSQVKYHIGLSNMLRDAGDHKGAIDACKEAVRLAPEVPGIHAMYANVLQHAGEVEEAISVCLAALDENPTSMALLGAVVIALNYSDRATPEQVLALHKRFGSLLEHHARPVPRPPPAPPAGRKLRIGYMSPDFRQHVISHFAEPFLEHHDRERFEIFIYSTSFIADAVTERFKKLPLTWRELAGVSDEEAARKIAADRLDILVELSGLSSGSRPMLMAHRPAPIQITYCGYPNTTGLTSIEYRIVDAVTDPAGAEQWMTEKPLRLPGCFLCYRPLDRAPEIVPRPGVPPITFGSFNNAAKLSDRCIALWARVLHAVPGSTLVLKCKHFKCPWVRSRFAERFAAAGIAADRIEIVTPIEDKSGHFGAYSRIDIALDSLPYNGTTTTCEALYMGVPVITLEGRAHAGRVGASLLNAVGLDDLIARSEDDYIQVAAALASDSSRLQDLRQTLRPRMLASPLCDGIRFTRSLESAYETLLQAEPATSHS